MTRFWNKQVGSYFIIGNSKPVDGHIAGLIDTNVTIPGKYIARIILTIICLNMFDSS